MLLNCSAAKNLFKWRKRWIFCFLESFHSPGQADQQWLRTGDHFDHHHGHSSSLHWTSYTIFSPFHHSWHYLHKLHKLADRFQRGQHFWHSNFYHWPYLITDGIFDFHTHFKTKWRTYKQRMRTDNVSDVTFSTPEASPRRCTLLMPPVRPVCAIGTYFLDMPHTLAVGIIWLLRNC
jgi:hypothetical protein